MPSKDEVEHFLKDSCGKSKPPRSDWVAERSYAKLGNSVSYAPQGINSPAGP